MIKKVLISTLLFLSIASGSVFASVTDNLKFDGYIADDAKIFTEETIENVNKTLHDLNQKTDTTIAVVTIKSLEGMTIDKANEEILANYQISDAEKNNGLVFLISIDDHQLQILLDKGLVGEIKPEELKTIIDDNVIPYFQTTEFEKGIIRGTYIIADKIADLKGQKIEHFGVMPKKKTVFDKINKNWLWLLIIPIVAVIGGFIGSMIALRHNKNNKQNEEG